MGEIGIAGAYSSAFEVAFAANLIAFALANIVNLIDSKEQDLLRYRDQLASGLDSHDAIGREWFWLKISEVLRWLRRASWKVGFVACVIGTVTFFLVLWHVPPDLKITNSWLVTLQLVAHIGPAFMLGMGLFGILGKWNNTWRLGKLSTELDDWAARVKRKSSTA